MSRSIKKGPFVAPELMKRVEEMNNVYILLLRIYTLQDLRTSPRGS